MNAATMEMDKLPKNLRPIIQVVPDWFNPKKLGLLFEAKVRKSKVLVCSIDLETNLASRPVARQFRYSILTYMRSESFNPNISLTIEQLKNIYNSSAW